MTGEMAEVVGLGLCRRDVGDGLKQRRFLNRAAHSSTAISTASLVFHGPRQCINNSALYGTLRAAANVLVLMHPLYRDDKPGGAGI